LLALIAKQRYNYLIIGLHEILTNPHLSP